MKFSKCFLWLSIGVILFTLPETSFAQDGNDMLRSIHAGAIGVRIRTEALQNNLKTITNYLTD